MHRHCLTLRQCNTNKDKNRAFLSKKQAKNVFFSSFLEGF